MAAYDRDAALLFSAYDGIDPAELYLPVRDLLPSEPALIADIGAGTGRDAAWLADLGHRVTAVEPAKGLREAGRAAHTGRRITWIDDRLPRMDHLLALGQRFDLLLLSGVWQHLTASERTEAMLSLARLVADGGTVLLSFRHGPGAPARPVCDLPIAETRADAVATGFTIVAERPAGSLQPGNRAAGVTWTWLGLRRT